MKIYAASRPLMTADDWQALSWAKTDARTFATKGQRHLVVMIEHVPEGGRAVAYPLRHHPLHSPDSFEWGYGGSGPRDLAIALLLDHFDSVDSKPEDLDPRVLSRFCDGFVVPAPKEGWRPTSDGIDARTGGDLTANAERD